MNGLELLARAEDIRREICRRNERIMTLRSLAEAISRPLPGDVRVQSTPDPCRTQRLVDEIVDEEAAIRLLAEEQGAVLEEVALLISRLPDSMSASVLHLRYLENLSWQEIFRRIHLSRSRTFDLHRNALKLLGSWEVKMLQSGGKSGYTL